MTHHTQEACLTDNIRMKGSSNILPLKAFLSNEVEGPNPPQTANTDLLRPLGYGKTPSLD